MLVNEQLRTLKPPIRRWVNDFPDQLLAEVLAFTQDGKLSINSCCCLVGVRTAPHVLEQNVSSQIARHLIEARQLPGAKEAEKAYKLLDADDHIRRRRLIPILKGVQRVRDRQLVTTSERIEEIPSV